MFQMIHFSFTMGQQPSRDKTLSDERMEQLIANTNLTKKEISMALGKFLAKTRFTINDIQLEHRVGLLQVAEYKRLSAHNLILLRYR